MFNNLKGFIQHKTQLSVRPTKATIMTSNFESRVRNHKAYDVVYNGYLGVDS